MCLYVCAFVFALHAVYLQISMCDLHIYIRISSCSYVMYIYSNTYFHTDRERHYCGYLHTHLEIKYITG